MLEKKPSILERVLPAAGWLRRYQLARSEELGIKLDWRPVEQRPRAP
jgi:hypothetical protein